MMSKLYKDSRFSQARPSVDIQRSSFPLDHGHHMTMNSGILYPYFSREVLPGSTFDFSDAFVCRTAAPLKTPVMDTAYLDRWLFYVPFRLVWEHTKEFYGENNVSAWTPQQEYYMPFLTPEGNGWKADGVADNFGIPTFSREPINALRHRSYRLIWNEWFRDQNTQDPRLVNMGDIENDLTLDDLLPVNKRKDYFTTALPEPQKGPDVLLPLAGDIPVVAGASWQQSIIGNTGLRFYIPSSLGTNVMNAQFFAGDHSRQLGIGTQPNVEPEGEPTYRAIPENLHALADMTSAPTINDLRLAFAVQGLYELDARCGSRYREFLHAHFGVTVPDLTVQVPQFLAGSSDVINVSQVVQTSATNVEVSAQGNVSGLSKTVGKGCSFTYSFTEPGYVIGVCAIRTQQSYQQGIDKSWLRKSRLDFYHPILDSIGETPILNKEIYAYGADKDEVFGYQEAYGDYRYAQSYVSGAFRSNYPGGSLDYWTYTNNFDGTPRLSDGFIRETDRNVARTIAVDDESAPQFLVDFYFRLNAVQPMSAYPKPAILGGRQ